ncbi:nuclear transport factor 2 family protein [Nonlabens ponticola]|uniref:SnoaL-like domain-containing protein n=1 Tax=Nonlabens ponticola TaxID=2496866 RepID=A0A3S9MUY2_9FLAO|nr:nuclear transport factor 2 family protein [Nonlabens ponticola]AZQ42978.1 hypothetical protein EJ995_01540 [Nonlabens ponticola]
MKKAIFLLAIILLTACSSYQNINKDEVSQQIDNWHAAASSADFDAYFNLMTSDAVFIGTDASENWQLEEFKAFSKPYFDKGKAWSFTSLERNIYERSGVIYFDELLDTQMGICRGSGVMYQQDGVYKIAHYVLSPTVPNDNMNEVTQLKASWDTTFKSTLKR